MSKVALITGGTSGIGAAFARRLAREGHDLVLVARGAERLAENAEYLKAQYGVEVETLSADLATDDGVHAVSERLQSETKPVTFFVNNAGFGLKGKFLEITAEDHDRLMAVNIRAAHLLQHAALGAMSKRGDGDVINVASVAAFTPAFRSSGTYSATKAFIVSVTESLAPAFEKMGVRLSAVCPGFVVSEFHERAGIDMTKMPKFMWLDADNVVEAALAGHRKGGVVVVPGLQYKAIVLFTRLLPRRLVIRVARRLGRRSH